MTTTRKASPPLQVLPFCHNCKPADAVIVTAAHPRLELCSRCGRETLSGVYAIQKAADA